MNMHETGKILKLYKAVQFNKYAQENDVELLKMVKMT